MTYDELATSRPGTTDSSVASSHTHVQSHEKSVSTPPKHTSSTAPGHHGSTPPEHERERGTGGTEEDWEHDPENARNWPLGKKWRAVSVVSLYTFCSPLASSMMAPGLPEVAVKYGITDSPTLIALTLSIFLFSFAIGPLVFAPLSEMYGRTWVLHIANIFTMALSIGCAFSPNVGSLVAFRFLSGLSGSAPIAIGGGSVSDVFAERDRASAMAIFTLGPLVGPVVGPIAGGFIAQEVGIEWVFIAIACTCGFASLVGIPLLRETYAPVIRMRRASRLNDPEAARFHPALHQANGSILRVLWVNLSRPVILLFRSFICFILSLYMAFLYGIFYLMFSTFAAFFSKTYGFKAGVGGLAYLGLGVGFFIATMVGAKFAGEVYQYLASKNGGVGKPEMRIPALFFGSFFIPVGLFWYGWSAAAKLHWIMPIIGSGIFGFGMMTTFLPIQLYLVDTFTYAASATAAASLFRSLLGFAFPLFGSQMYEAMGIGGGNSLLAGLAIVLGIPFPVWIYYKGEQMRARNPLTADSVKRTNPPAQPKGSIESKHEAP